MLDELETRHDAEKAEIRDELISTIAQRQMEAYALGKEQGMAIGQMQGQQMLLAELSRFQDERRGEYVTPADIERARKGLVH